MITKEQAEELRRLIGAHTAAQVTFDRRGRRPGLSRAAATAVCAYRSLEDFISRITEKPEDA